MDIVSSESDLEQVLEGLSIFGFVLTFAVLLPFMIYTWNRLLKYEKHETMKIRKPKHLKQFLIFGSIISFIIVPLALLEAGFDAFPKNESYLGFASFLICINIFFCLTDMNVAAMFLKIKQNEELQDWHLVLDADYHPKNIMIRYSLKDPNLKCYNITFSTVSSLIIFFIGLFGTHGQYMNIINAQTSLAVLLSFELLVGLWQTILFIIMVKQIIIFDDKYYFTQQTKLLTKVELIGIALFLAGAILINTSIQFWAVWGIVWTQAGMIFCCWSYILFPISMIGKNEQLTINGKMIADDGNSQSKSRLKRMVSIIENATTFEQFINHLITEFSSENLLFIIYVIKFQNFLIETNFIESADNQIDHNLIFIQSNWVLPRNIPQCSLFVKSELQENVNDRIWKIFAKIFEKFIQRDSAPLEINISDARRIQLENWYLKFQQRQNHGNSQISNDNNELDELVSLWKCIKQSGLEIWRLMGDSLGRFEKK